MKINDIIRKVRLDRNKTQQETATYIGITQGNYSKYEKGTIDFTMPIIEKLCYFFNVEMTDLLCGLNESAVINYYPDVSASAGHGNEVFSEISQRFDFYEHAYNKMLKKAKKLDVITVEGDSMYPQYKTGDLLFVDTTQSVLCDGGVYVIRTGQSLRVKLVQEQGSKLLLVSINSNYRDIVLELKNDEYDELGIRVIGKVIGAITFN